MFSFLQTYLTFPYNRRLILSIFHTAAPASLILLRRNSLRLKVEPIDNNVFKLLAVFNEDYLPSSYLKYKLSQQVSNENFEFSSWFWGLYEDARYREK